MRQIRKGVFETNSSSTHSICIAKSNKYNIPKVMHFGIGEWGWENDILTDTDKADYLYTGLLANNRDDDIEKLKIYLDESNIAYTFAKPKWSYYGEEKTIRYLENGHIDHSYELEEFLNVVMSDKDKLFRYLFNDDSCIYTGNDNDDSLGKLCDSADPTFYDWDKRESFPNPNHHPDKFEYFDKGN